MIQISLTLAVVINLPRSSVCCMGAYEPDELHSRLQGIDAVVMASRWYENSPMVIQEAFSHGVPVIAPNCGGMAEKIQHHSTGLLYEKNDCYHLAQAIYLVAENPGLVAEMSKNCKKTSSSFESILSSYLMIGGE